MDRRIYGLETEYALGFEPHDPGRPLPAASDANALWSELERALLKHYRTIESDSFGRNPNRPPRGATPGDIAIREGYFLESGARCYYDTGHVEWATPEASSPFQAVLYETAGERTLVELARQTDLAQHGRILLLKNNVDYNTAKPTTFGCHENYLLDSRTHSGADTFRELGRLLVPFLVTRQLYCGAGKIGRHGGAPATFQISQRADFIEQIASLNTRDERAILNTRNEKPDVQTHQQRLHLILGDSNLSSFANALKLGATGLLLRMIEEDAAMLSDAPQLTQPIAALHLVSRSSDFRQQLNVRGPANHSAVDIQQWYLDRVNEFLQVRGADAESQRILAMWQGVLDDLRSDWRRLADRVDWAIKWVHLLEPRASKSGLNWDQMGADTPPDEPRQREAYFKLRDVDLRYHDIDPARGLFYFLQRKGLVRNELNDERVAQAQHLAPADTRARLRAHIIHWAHDHACAQRITLDWGQAQLAVPAPTNLTFDPFETTHAELTQLIGLEPERAPVFTLTRDDFEDAAHDTHSTLPAVAATTPTQTTSPSPAFDEIEIKILEEQQIVAEHVDESQPGVRSWLKRLFKR